LELLRERNNVLLRVFPMIMVPIRVCRASTHNIAAVSPHIDVWAKLPRAIHDHLAVTKEVVTPMSGDCSQSINP